MLGDAEIRYTGIDVSNVIIERCRRGFSELPRTEFLARGIEDFSEDRDYDAVVFNEILYYLSFSGAAGAFRKAVKLVARRDGIVVVSMNDNWKARLIWMLLSAEASPFQSLSVRNDDSASRWSIRVYGASRGKRGLQ